MFVRDGVISGVSAIDELTGPTFYLPDTALNWSQVRALNAHGAVVFSRQVVLNPPNKVDYTLGDTNLRLPPYFSLVVAIAGFALFEVCLLAAAAFLVGTRVDRRSFATIASVGGDRRVLFRIVSFGGLVLGGLGGLLGSAVGVGVGYLYQMFVDDGSRLTHPGFHVEPVSLIII